MKCTLLKIGLKKDKL